ncbi:hypothetical protein [Planctomycetes bacterium K23_9]|uniref:Peptidylprolyl isomerase n=1 Tax=Stieleria marina TaxID=1930275 RepID=A0A517P177_9BACT|nr:hypothetical protein K239x_51440 [Planctomycetes bacterium K23_9]
MCVRILERVCVVLLLVLCFPQFASSQGVSINNGRVRLTGFGDVDAEKTIEDWADRERVATTGELNLQIELLTEICGLSEGESKKLKLAAMTVSQRRLVTGRKQMRQFIYESGLVPLPPDAAEIQKTFDDVLTPFRAKKGDGFVVIQTRFQQALNERPLWGKVIKSTLSPAQYRKYDDHCRNRNRVFVDASVSQSLAILDAQVFLTAFQQDAIRKSVTAAMLPTITLQRPSSVGQADQNVRPWFGNRDHLKPFLRESQLKRLVKIDEVQKAGGGVGWSN